MTNEEITKEVKRWLRIKHKKKSALTEIIDREGITCSLKLSNTMPWTTRDVLRLHEYGVLDYDVSKVSQQVRTWLNVNSLKISIISEILDKHRVTVSQKIHGHRPWSLKDIDLLQKEGIIKI